MPDQVIASGDPTAQALLKEYGAPMPNVGVNQQQAEQLLAYIDFQSGGAAPAQAGAPQPTGGPAPQGSPATKPLLDRPHQAAPRRPGATPPGARRPSNRSARAAITSVGVERSARTSRTLPPGGLTTTW